MTGQPWRDRAFDWLMRLFPAEFRGDFGDEMSADFRDQRAEAVGGGRQSVIRLWRRTVLDALRRAPLEHLDIFRRDAWYALRLLRRHPGFTATVVLTLAIGIGLNTAVFSVVSGVLLRELPVPNGDRVVRLFEVEAAQPDVLHDTSSTAFLEWQEGAKALDALALSTFSPGTFIDEDGDPESMVGIVVTDRFFEIIGAAPAIGRTFTGDEYRTGTMVNVMDMRPTVALLTHDLWQRRFGSRPDVIGATFRIGDRPLEVVGVMPAGLDMRGLSSVGQPQYWIPGRPNTAGAMGRRRNRGISAIGRLAPGISRQAAQAEFDAIAASTAAHDPEAGGWSVQVLPPLDGLVRGVRSQLWLFGAAACCVLLIAAANVTNLLLVHASGRRLEQATRVAIGATRGHLVRQLLTEGMMLGLVGGAVGVLIAYLTVPALIELAPGSVPRLDTVAVDSRVLAFAAVVSLAVGLGCGLVASGVRDHRALDRVLRSGRIDARSQGRRVRQGLIAGQVALAMLLVVAAGLMVRTMSALGDLELGFDPQNVISVNPQPNFRRLGGGAGRARFNAELLAQIRRLPGVIAAGTGPTPFRRATGTTVSAVPGAEGERAEVNPVTPGYLRALRIRPISGRLFDEADERADVPVALVSESAARWLWGESTPLGQSVFMSGGDWATVVGVVADLRRNGLEGEFEPTVYLLATQSTRLGISGVFIRTQGDPHDIVPGVQTALKRLDPEAPLVGVRTLDDLIAAQTAPRRFVLQLVGLFSLIALALATLGVYGVLAESVAQRVPEIGVRMALGATRRRITAMVVWQGVGLVAIGSGVGLVAAFGARDVMASFVFGVKTSDAWTYAAACACVMAAALAVSALPARRAASIDPVAALREG